MRRLIVVCLSLILSLSMILLVFNGCAQKDSGKIPVTTLSKEARDAFLTGRDLAERLQAQESKEYFEKAVELDPEFALAWMQLSFAQPSAKEFFAAFDKAKEFAEKASEGERLWIMGFNSGVYGISMEQREHYTKMTELYPNDERAHNLLGTHYFGQQEYETAIGHYQKAAEINPEFSQPYNQLGYSYRFLGNYEEAEKAFQKYIELIPDDPNPYDSYAELLMKMGKFDESIENYQKALAQNPNFVASFVGIALNYNWKGEHMTARETLTKLLENARTDGEKRTAYFNMAVSLIDEGVLDMALEEIGKQYEIAAAIEDPANMGNDLGLMGNILFEMGKFDEAQAKFDEAHKIVQESELADEVKANNGRFYLFNSARVALQKKDVESAHAKSAEFMTAVTELDNPNQIKLAHQLEGCIALHEKDYEKAVAELLQSNLNFNPYNYFRLGMAYKAMEDLENTQANFKKAAEYWGLDGLNYAFCRQKALKMLEG